MLFSIIIPTYNRAHLIEKTIKSILNQTYQNFEVIIVDNCSTDNTIHILEKYIEDKRFKIIINERNYERSHSRNVGMNNALGDFLTFLDSDDIMGENCLQDAYNYHIENEEVEIFHNKYLFCDENGNKISTFQDKINYNMPQNSILRGNFLACIGVFINRRIYKIFRFNEDLKIIGSEDWFFWIQIIFDTKNIGLINKINSFITQHDGRTENNRNPFDFENQILYLKKCVLGSIKLNSKENRILNFSTVFLISSDYCDAGEKKIALRKLVNMLFKHPEFFFNLKVINLFKNIIFKSNK